MFYATYLSKLFNFEGISSLVSSDSPIRKFLISVFSVINLISSEEWIPLSQTSGFLWSFNILNKLTVVSKEISRVFRFLLFIPIIEFSKERAN